MESPLAQGRGLKHGVRIALAMHGMSPLAQGRGLKRSFPSLVLGYAIGRPSRRGVD